MNNRLKNFKRKLSRRLLFNAFIFAMIYTAIIIALFFAAAIFLRQFIWYGDDFLYQILHLIDANGLPFIMIVLGMGYILIFLYFWFKTLSYLENIIEAAGKIYDPEDSFISLETNLKEVEILMNEIKFKVRQDERAAREAEQRKNDLIVYLAHDLKTPLTSVIGYLTLLHDEQQISKELEQKYLAITLDKAQRLEDLINEFFEITRFNLTNLTLEYSRVNLTRMLEQITFEFQPMLKEKDLGCSLISPSNLEIKCDADKLQRVFDNLIRNAINYSFSGSSIQIRVEKQGESVLIDVINRGNTIPQEKLNRIFEQFFRLDTARTSKSGGAGLGLAIAKEIVELHKGSITAYSEQEVIRFHITLPDLL